MYVRRFSQATCSTICITEWPDISVRHSIPGQCSLRGRRPTFRRAYRGRWSAVRDRTVLLLAVVAIVSLTGSIAMLAVAGPTDPRPDRPIPHQYRCRTEQPAGSHVSTRPGSQVRTSRSASSIRPDSIRSQKRLPDRSPKHGASAVVRRRHTGGTRNRDGRRRVADRTGRRPLSRPGR